MSTGDPLCDIGTRRTLPKLSTGRKLQWESRSSHRSHIKRNGLQLSLTRLDGGDYGIRTRTIRGPEIRPCPRRWPLEIKFDSRG